MTFEEIVDQAMAMVRRRGRVTYRMLQRHFGLDAETLEDLKEELVYGQRLAVDEDQRVLIWVGEPTSAASPISVPETISPQAGRPLVIYPPTYLTEKILRSPTALAGERKQVTVLFADIKDSTELITDLDPEAAQQLLDPAIRIMMDAVHRFEGTVNQVLGDGIMALFGAPIAHEDHAVRACYAALEMQAVMRDYTAKVRRTQGLELRIRVGLNSGEVVVRTIGNDLHMDYSAVGLTTHLAARMEQLATPGGIRLSSATFWLVEGFVLVNALGPIPVKGITEPVDVYELTGASTIKRRLQAAVTRGLTKFVGRSTEIELLNQAQEHARTGHGQVVAVVGEAGVGKSRLVYEFVHSHRSRGWRVLETASVSYGKATPYYPIIDLLRYYVQVEEGDDPRTIRARVMGQILTLDESLQDTIPALLSLLDVLPEGSPFLQHDPPQRRQRTLDALIRILLRESQVQPLLLVFEDLHWHDSESQAVLDSLVESLPTAQLLLLVNYRPEYRHGWGHRTYYTQLRLEPLPPASAEAFLHSLLGDDPSLQPLKRLLIERTEGNPFFLEESVRTLVETQVLAGESHAYRLVQALPTIQVPATVQAVLAARIDRLPQDQKRLLQIAAVIGIDIQLSLLQAVVGFSEEALYGALTHLQAAGFLDETSLFPERLYTFKHALTHEVAYGSLLHERRRMLHARIVEALETGAGGRLADQIERLAQHAFRGEVWDKALYYYREAGEKAGARSAYREAVTCHEQALNVLQHLPEGRQTRELAVDLLFKLRHALTPVGEFSRGFAYLREAETIAEALDDPPRLGWASAFMAFYCSLMGAQDRAIASSQRALAIATAHDIPALQDEANTHLGQAYYTLGAYGHALAILRPSVAHLEGDWLRERIRSGSLVPVFSRTVLVLCLAEAGAFQEGHARGAEGLQIAETTQHAFSLILAYWGIGLLALAQGDLQQATPVLKRGIELCQTANLPALLPIFVSALSYAYALDARHTEALAVLDQAMAAIASLQETALAFGALVSVWLGKACLLTGRIDAASALAAQAHNLSQVHKGRGHEAWALHLLGDIAMHREPPETDQANTRYQHALVLADELGMDPLQSHCHRSLGLLYRQAGQTEQACIELSTAINMYRAMEMSFWLPEIEATLAELKSEQ